MNNEKVNKVDEILGSLDGVKRAMAPDYFYTRLRARLESEAKPRVSRHWALRPAYALIALLLVLLINAAVLYRADNNDNATNETAMNATSDTESIQNIASEYSVSDAGSVYDLNQEK